VQAEEEKQPTEQLLEDQHLHLLSGLHIDGYQHQENREQQQQQLRRLLKEQEYQEQKYFFRNFLKLGFNVIFFGFSKILGFLIQYFPIVLSH
jgi:hypothetical protein